MNFLGIVVALATFVGIWWGHVGVRVIERRTERLWIPIAGALTLGAGLEAVALFADSRMLSAAAGILGVTALWDALEFVRQEKRIKHGHAPANRDNPRHARVLAEYDTATTLDLLNRDPVGRPVTPAEAAALVEPPAPQVNIDPSAGQRGGVS